MQHFRQDLDADSLRNRLRVDSHYYVLKLAHGRRRESGLASVVGNIPSRYLDEGREEEAVNAIVAAMHEHTGFDLATGAGEASLDRETYAVECTYVLRHSVTGAERTWTGSWRNTWGRLTDFVPLVSRRDVLAQVRRFSVPGAVEELLEDRLGHLESEWEYDGLVSLVLNFELRGFFPDRFRSNQRVTFLD